MDAPDASQGPAETGEVRLAAGARVEVRNTLDRSWSKGFEVLDVDDEGRYRIVRRSDDAVLPGRFAPEDVRRERRRSTWWV